MTKQQITKTFLDLVKIDSPSGEERKVAAYIIRYLKKFRIKTTPDRFGSLVARVPGQGKPLMLETHMDTVEPGRGIKPGVRGDMITSDGTTILGADDKAGVTAVLEAVRYLSGNNITHRPLELIFAREEETGLTGAFNLDYKTIRSKEALVIDQQGPPGVITIAAPFYYTIDIEIKGKAAHAGAEPEKGISAIQAASKAIAALRLGRIDQSTTANVGVISGGTVRNAVPEHVTVKAEARSLDNARARKRVAIIRQTFVQHVKQYGARLEFKGELSCHGYRYAKSDPFIRKIASANKRLGIKTVYHAAGGASDANVMAGKGIKAVDISCGYANAHTTRECVRISDMMKTTKFLAEFVKI